MGFSFLLRVDIDKYIMLLLQRLQRGFRWGKQPPTLQIFLNNGCFHKDTKPVQKPENLVSISAITVENQARDLLRNKILLKRCFQA